MNLAGRGTKWIVFKKMRAASILTLHSVCYVAILSAVMHNDTQISDPEYIRPSQVPRFGMCRSTAYNLMRDGCLKTKLIRRPGNVKGIRLISVKSLRAFIEGSPEK
jgi:hypothetical protein